ncbi:hypothetical protein MMPV_007907 [Pyropia vietnamensis]
MLPLLAALLPLTAVGVGSAAGASEGGLGGDSAASATAGAMAGAVAATAQSTVSAASSASSAPEAATPEAALAAAHVTDRVYFDVAIGGRPAGRLVIGLFGDAAPATATTFKALAEGRLRGRAGRTVGYKYSTVWRVRKGARIDFGRVVQIDSLNQLPGTPQRVDVGVEVPLNSDATGLRDVVGAVSGPAGGGAFEWRVNVGSGAEIELSPGEPETLVFGRVLDGWDVLDAIGGVAVNQKTMRDGLKKVGKAIGDSRAKVMTEDKPLIKIAVMDCGVL